jgi:hypothetical protein
LAAAGFLAWTFGYPAALKYFFRVSGTVDINSGLVSSMPGPNSTLFLVALNEGGVPVAVKKVINPVFPVKFEMTPSNLIMPDLLTRKLYLNAMMNTHGQLNSPRRGDLKGDVRAQIGFRQKGIAFALDAVVKQ